MPDAEDAASASVAATARLPLSALLSQALVAFTIEFDNEFEHRMPHRTSTGPSSWTGGGPWLVSQAMWSNFMRYAEPGGSPFRDLAARAAITNLAGLERWGYIIVAPSPSDPRPRPPRADWIVRPTAAGVAAREVWHPLAALIEGRWRDRSGDGAIDRLRTALAAIAGRSGVVAIDYLPVLHYGLATVLPKDLPAGVAGRTAAADGLDLAALLSRALLAFALAYEREAPVSLAIGANVMRVLSADGVRVRDIPRRTGVSKEAVAVSLGYLGRRGLATIAPDPDAARVKVARLTATGRAAQAAHGRLMASIEERWGSGSGDDLPGELTDVLERLAGRTSAGPSALFAGLEPYPDGWRASVPRPETLPYFPTVLHRGGFPDGS